MTRNEISIKNGTHGPVVHYINPKSNDDTAKALSFMKRHVLWERKPIIHRPENCVYFKTRSTGPVYVKDDNGIEKCLHAYYTVSEDTAYVIDELYGMSMKNGYDAFGNIGDADDTSTIHPHVVEAILEDNFQVKHIVIITFFYMLTRIYASIKIDECSYAETLQESFKEHLDFIDSFQQTRKIDFAFMTALKADFKYIKRRDLKDYASKRIIAGFVDVLDLV